MIIPCRDIPACSYLAGISRNVHNLQGYPDMIIPCRDNLKKRDQA